MIEFIVELAPFFVLGLLIGLLWHTRSIMEELTWAKEGHDVSLEMLRERIERLEDRTRHRDYVEARKRGER